MASRAAGNRWRWWPTGCLNAPVKCCDPSGLMLILLLGIPEAASASPSRKTGWPKDREPIRCLMADATAGYWALVPLFLFTPCAEVAMRQCRHHCDWSDP